MEKLSEEIEIIPGEKIEPTEEKDTSPKTNTIGEINPEDTDYSVNTIEIKGDDIIDDLNSLPIKKLEVDEIITTLDRKTPTTKNIEPKIIEQNSNIIKKQILEKSLAKKQYQQEEEIEPEEKTLNKTPIEILKEEVSETPEKKELLKGDKKEDTKTSIKKEEIESPKKEGFNSLIKTVRTYQDDVIKTMKEQKTSLTKMVVAEKKKQEKTGIKIKKESGSKKKIMFITTILISIVIVGGLVGFYFFKESQPKIPPTIKELQIPNFIFPNYVKEIYLSRLNRDKIIENLELEKTSISIPLSSIIQLYLTKEDQTKQFIIEETEGNKLLITTDVFFNTIGTKTPPILTRSLSSDFMFGYHSSLGNNPFLFFNVKSYNNAFSGMLEWENTILKDLSPIFTKEGSKIDLENKNFKDIIISNKDVRAILGTDGKIEFAYSFPNKETLVIINNETTFQELLRRIINASLERKN